MTILLRGLSASQWRVLPWGAALRKDATQIYFYCALGKWMAVDNYSFGMWVRDISSNVYNGQYRYTRYDKVFVVLHTLFFLALLVASPRLPVGLLGQYAYGIFFALPVSMIALPIGWQFKKHDRERLPPLAEAEASVACRGIDSLPNFHRATGIFGTVTIAFWLVDAVLSKGVFPDGITLIFLVLSIFCVVFLSARWVYALVYASALAGLFIYSTPNVIWQLILPMPILVVAAARLLLRQINDAYWAILQMNK